MHNTRFTTIRPNLPALIWLALFLLLTQSAVQADPLVITIHYHERSPYYETVDGKLGGIIGERVRAVFEEARVPHIFKKTPPKRQLMLLEVNAHQDCMVGWFHTPDRGRVASFSRPIYRDSPQMILAKADNPLFDGSSTLEQILSNRSPRLLVKDNHSYGSALDIMMARLVPRIVVTTTDNSSMVRMVHAGRADYMFLAKNEAEQIIASAGVDRNDLRLTTLPGTPEGNKRYLLFSKKVDRNLIKRINQAIDKLYPLGSGK